MNSARKILPVVALVCATSFTVFAAAAPQGPTRNCSLPQFRQFDFWIGDWDAYDSNAPDRVVGRARITGILEGCVVHEEYRQSDGLRGESFNTYDSARRVWHQTWVTNRGDLLILEGKFENGVMTLAGTDHGKKGKVRVWWKAVSNGVLEKAERSLDGGKTWKVWFDMQFRAHRD